MKDVRKMKEVNNLIGHLTLSLLELETLIQSKKAPEEVSAFEDFINREITLQSHLVQQLSDAVKKIENTKQEWAVPLIELAIKRARERSRELMMSRLEYRGVRGLRH